MSYTIYSSKDLKKVGLPGHPRYFVDEATGLPEVLDEGAYFKVSKGRMLWSGYHIISYMIPRRWWFDKKAVFREEISGLSPLTASSILRTSLRLIEERDHVLKMKSDPEYRSTYKAKQKVARKKSKAERKDSSRRYAERQRDMQDRESRLLGKYPPKNLEEL